MMTETVPTEENRSQSEPSRGASAFGLLAAPAAYAVVAVVNYFLAPAACAMGLGGGFTVLKIVTFLITALGLLVAVWAGYRSYRYVQRSHAAGASSDDSSRFLGVGGIMLAVLFSALTIIAGLSGLALQPCRPV
jgi:hypothetical protein